MYLNEIIVRLFQSHEADPAFFKAYEEALFNLNSQAATEIVLRGFELSLLDTLGYGVDFSSEAHSHDPIDPESWYYFQEESGFIKVQESSGVQLEASTASDIYSGVALLNIDTRDFSEDLTRKTAKQVIRSILANHLGSNPLRSRALFSRS